MRMLLKMTLMALAVLALMTVTSMADDTETYEVRVTNLTRGQIISAPVVAAHNADFSLFELGAPASPQLAAVAEDALEGDLVQMLMDHPDVAAVEVAGGGILPGHTGMVFIEAGGNQRLISAVGMLVTTNDTFFAVRGVRTPRGNSITSVVSPGYDAGTEANNELCEFIPGPPCGNGEVHTDESEGYIYIQNGIHGVGSLEPAEFDWRNPVARISIRRAD